MEFHGRGFGARAGALLLAAAVLLGVACPHCELAHSGEAAVAEAAPPCHSEPAERTPAASEPGAALDCSCPSCEIEAGIAFVATGPGVPAASGVVLLRGSAASPVVRAAFADWTPPPYPGFSDHTVVRLN